MILPQEMMGEPPKRVRVFELTIKTGSPFQTRIRISCQRFAEDLRHLMENARPWSEPIQIGFADLVPGAEDERSTEELTRLLAINRWIFDDGLPPWTLPEEAFPPDPPGVG